MQIAIILCAIIIVIFVPLVVKPTKDAFIETFWPGQLQFIC